jgi:hypothetical protein
MAPRAPESFESIAARIRAPARTSGARVPFQARGLSHFSHVACDEGGTWRVRTWWLDPDKARAYLAQHGHFMPENAEAISEPGKDVLLEARDVEALLHALRASGLV